MPTSKSQRLVNLVLCLLSTRVPVTAQHIRENVEGYHDAASDDAFIRTFERDKAELRKAGVDIEYQLLPDSDELHGYRIRREQIELPPLNLTPRAAAALAVVGQVWSSMAPDAEDNAHITGALGKLRAAELRPAATAPIEGGPGEEREFTTAAALAEMAAAHRVVRFAYTATGETESHVRTLEPWLVGTRSGHWYVVGHDLDRGERRSFRVSRLSSLKALPQRTAKCPRPEPEQAQQLLDQAATAFDVPITAKVWVAADACAELRASSRRCHSMPRGGVVGDELELHMSQARLARLIAGAGTQAIALEPPELIHDVTAILRVAAALPPSTRTEAKVQEPNP